jgi:hypothetical protein
MFRSPKELHHKHQDLLAGKASNRIKSYIVNLNGEVHQRFVAWSSERRNRATQLIANQKAESSPENGALTGINTGLGCSPDPQQHNDPEDEDRDGLWNVGLHKTEPPYPADSPKELHHKHHVK